MNLSGFGGWLRHELKTILYVHLGCFMYALSVTMFVVPAKMPGAGITGLSLILNYLWNIPLGISNVVLNGILFIYGWKFLSRRFFYWSLYATVLLSILYDLTALLPVPELNDILVVALVGGVLQGFALALIFSVGASSGGTDIVIMAIKRKHGFEVGTLSMWLNFAVLALFIPLSPFHLLIYGVVMTYLKGVVMNNDVRSFATKKEVLILPCEPDLVKNFIVKELGKGVTVFEARGGYDNQPHQVFLTLLTSRQAIALKFFLKNHDPKAFLRVGEVTEVFGRGFGSLHRDL